MDVIRSKIEAAALRAGREPKDVKLLGVTKNVDIDAMRAAFDLGICNFGENRVQEFLRKSDILDRECRWHLIGRLQTNKVKYLDEKSEPDSFPGQAGTGGSPSERGEQINYRFPVLVQVNVSGRRIKKPS